jgi:hypothetical protein
MSQQFQHSSSATYGHSLRGKFDGFDVLKLTGSPVSPISTGWYTKGRQHGRAGLTRAVLL